MCPVIASVTLAVTLVAEIQLERQLASFPPPTVVNAWAVFAEARLKWLRYQQSLQPSSQRIDGMYRETLDFLTYWRELQDIQAKVWSVQDRLVRLRELESSYSYKSRGSAINVPFHQFSEGAPTQLEMKQLGFLVPTRQSAL
jgi:hypothetical protein